MRRKKTKARIVCSWILIILLSISFPVSADQSFSIKINATEYAVFALTFTGNCTGLSITSPSGITYNQGNAGAAYQAGAGRIQIGIRYAEAGRWAVTVYGNPDSGFQIVVTNDASYGSFAGSEAPIVTSTPTPLPTPTPAPTTAITAAPTQPLTSAPTPAATAPTPTPKIAAEPTVPKPTTAPAAARPTTTPKPVPAVVNTIETTSPPTPKPSPVVTQKETTAGTSQEETTTYITESAVTPVSGASGRTNALVTIEDALKQIDLKTALLGVVAILILLAIAWAIWKRHQIRTRYLRFVLWVQRRRTAKTENRIETHRKKQLALPDLQELETLKYKENELRRIQADQKRERKTAAKLQTERLAAETRINRLEIQKRESEAADLQRITDRARQEEASRIRAERDKQRREIEAKISAAKQIEREELQKIKLETKRIAKEEKKARLQELAARNTHERELRQIKAEQKKARMAAEKLEAKRIAAEATAARLEAKKTQREAVDLQRAIDRTRQEEDARIRTERDKLLREATAEKAKLEALHLAREKETARIQKAKEKIPKAKTKAKTDTATIPIPGITKPKNEPSALSPAQLELRQKYQLQLEREIRETAVQPARKEAAE